MDIFIFDSVGSLTCILKLVFICLLFIFVMNTKIISYIELWNVSFQSDILYFRVF